LVFNDILVYFVAIFFTSKTFSMNCNRCGKEMTKEARSDSWWCPFCGSTETMYSANKKPADKEKPS